MQCCETVTIFFLGPVPTFEEISGLNPLITTFKTISLMKWYLYPPDCNLRLPIGNSYFHNLMGFTSKKMSNIFHTNVCWKSLFIFLHVGTVSKIRIIVRWFQIRGNNCKKVRSEKVICQRSWQNPILHTSVFYNFFVSKFLALLNSFEISVKFCVVLIPIFKFCGDKVFRYY